MKIQYSGLSDVRTLLASDTVNGAVVGGILVPITWNAANNWVIDTTQAPYTGLAAGAAAALVALPNNEFQDVTSTGKTQFNKQEYPQTVGGQPAQTSHQVSAGAAPAVAVGAGTTAVAIGAIGANDQAGEITATGIASGMAANTVLVNVTFAVPYAAPPKDIAVNALNPATEAVLPYVPVASITAVGFQIMGEVAAVASAGFAFSYSVTG